MNNLNYAGSQYSLFRIKLIFRPTVNNTNPMCTSNLKTEINISIEEEEEEEEEDAYKK